MDEINNIDHGTFNDITKEEMIMVMMFRALTAEQKLEVLMDLAGSFDIGMDKKEKTQFDTVFYEDT